MKKGIFFIFLILLIAISGGAFHFYNKAALLKNHYPVWDFSKEDYILVVKKPKNWLKVSQISTEALWAIVLSEDWAFYDHPGIDVNQLEIALEQSVRAKRLIRGASTITQQVVKNSFLSLERSVLRKLKEMILALCLEQVLSKNKILEHYVNLIELGPNLYGIQNASYFYFQKSAKELNAKEGAFLAMLLPSPIRYSQSFRDRKLSEYASTQVSKILIKLKLAKKISEERKDYLDQFKLSFEN